MVGCANTWTGKGVGEMDWLIIGWAYTPDLTIFSICRKETTAKSVLTQ